ncbi:MAG: hypothetical protein PHV51_10150, partial [Methanosarcinaceae archaeon]|nr:hypothetical protein [Methanosarcinaceae archaeon]
LQIEFNSRQSFTISKKRDGVFPGRASERLFRDGTKKKLNFTEALWWMLKSPLPRKKTAV